MVGFVVHDQKLFLLGLDPATGKDLWQQHATPDPSFESVEFLVAAIGDSAVAYFRRVPT